MTSEERVARLEELSGTMATSIELLATNQQLLTGLIQRMDQQIQEMREQTQEWHRDSLQFQGLIIYIAQKNGWLDEGEWPTNP